MECNLIFYVKFLNLVLKHRASSCVEGTELNLVIEFSSFHFYPYAILFLSGLRVLMSHVRDLENKYKPVPMIQFLNFANNTQYEC